MKLFSTDLDRLGMLSSQALRAVAARRRLGHPHARLDAPAGDRLHARAHRRRIAPTSCRRSIATSSIPGQATAYMLGKLEISKARDEAQQAMGPTVRHQGVPRSRARGRRDPGAASCTRRSTAGPDEMMKRMIGAGAIAAAMAASPIAVAGGAARPPRADRRRRRVRRAGEDDRRAAGGADVRRGDVAFAGARLPRAHPRLRPPGAAI